MRDCNRKW